MDRYQQILLLANELGILRPRDLDPIGIPRAYLQRLTERGDLERVERGLYRLPDALITQYQSLLEVAKRVPASVICLLSALAYHDLTTQLPYRVWVALPTGSRTPQLAYLPLRIVRISGAAFAAGVEGKIIGNVPMKIYNPAKTIADCFKFRNKVGLDVAIEALRECLAERRASPDELLKYANICRVSKVMRPYLEALV